MFKHVFFNGGNQVGETYSLDEAAEFLATRWPEFWDKESAKEALEEAKREGEQLCCEDEHMNYLVPL